MLHGLIVNERAIIACLKVIALLKSICERETAVKLM